MTQALIVIDVQNEYVTGGLPIVHPPVDGSLERIGEAIDAATQHGVPVVLVRHTEPDPSGGLFVAGTPAWELHDVVASRPHAVVIDKSLPGSFTGTDLATWIADHDLGLDVTVLDDATGTIDVSADLPAALVHRVELGVLGDGFAQVRTTSDWVSSLG